MLRLDSCSGVRAVLYTPLNGVAATAFGEFCLILDGEPRPDAKVAELVDALDLGSSGVTRESSSLSFRTIHAMPLIRRNLSGLRASRECERDPGWFADSHNDRQV